MPSLTIRDIPETLLEKLREAGSETRRSVNALAVRWFEPAANQSMSQKRAQLLWGFARRGGRLPATRPRAQQRCNHQANEK